MHDVGLPLNVYEYSFLRLECFLCFRFGSLIMHHGLLQIISLSRFSLLVLGFSLLLLSNTLSGFIMLPLLCGLGHQPVYALCLMAWFYCI